MEPPENAKIFLEGIEVGATAIATADRVPKSISVTLTFKPNWVGLWRLQALMADSAREA